MRTFRLPDGTETTDGERYHEEWEKLCKAVEKLLPDYRVGGFDPDLLLHCRDSRKRGFNLPTDVALTLTQGK